MEDYPISTEFDEDTIIYLQSFDVGAKALVHDLTESAMEDFVITKVVCRSDDPDWYDKQSGADLDQLEDSIYSCEFIVDDDTYYVFLN